jgi:hypothetical protein
MSSSSASRELSAPYSASASECVCCVHFPSSIWSESCFILRIKGSVIAPVNHVHTVGSSDTIFSHRYSDIYAMDGRIMHYHQARTTTSSHRMLKTFRNFCESSAQSCFLGAPSGAPAGMRPCLCLVWTAMFGWGGARRLPSSTSVLICLSQASLGWITTRIMAQMLEIPSCCGGLCIGYTVK